MKEAIKKIKELEKELKSVDKRLKEVRNCESYDFLIDERYSIVFDIKLEAERLLTLCEWEIEDVDKIHDESIGTGRKIYSLMEMSEIRNARKNRK